MKANTQASRGPIELIEEAFHLLRLSSLPTLLSYYLGAIPFVLAVLYFWSDMSRGVYADERLALETAGLTFLFLWMKCWQAIFARQLRAQIIGHPAVRLTSGQIWRIWVHQAILQPAGLFLIPVALLLLFPIGWVYGFFQSVTALGGNDQYDLKALLRKGMKQAALWPLQNNYVIFMFKGFSIFVFLNLASGTVMIFYLLATFLGIQTAFTQSMSAFLNTTFLAAISALTYLCVDPIIKAAYVIRCFYGESRNSGEDLKAELRACSMLAQKAAMLLLLVALALTAGTTKITAAEAATASSPANVVKPNELDQAIERTLQKPEYTWRLPREQKVEHEKKGYLASLIDRLISKMQEWAREAGKLIDRFIRWLTGRQSGNSGGRGLSFDWLFGIKGLIVALVLVIAIMLIWLLVRLWKARASDDIREIATEAIQPMPDLEDENVGADQLPEDGWISMARDLLARGEPRLALRALYLASLAHLAQRNLITIARFKSNRDYERELGRRAHALPDVMATFTENVSIFDRIWYGTHEVNASLLNHFEGNLNKIKAT